MFLGMLSVMLGFLAGGGLPAAQRLAGVFTGFFLTIAAWFGRLPWALYGGRAFALVALSLALFGGLSYRLAACPPAR